MLSFHFLAEFKRATEQIWSERSINPATYRFQFQRGTRWNPGLAEDKVREYENAIGARFPTDFRTFLQVMNGTDIPTLNVYGYCGEPHRTSVGVYAYPKDLEIVRRRIEDVRESRNEISNDLGSQDFDLPSDAALVPIYGDRYIVCTSNPDQSVVLSVVVHETDAIVYGACLQEYLEREFLGTN